MYSSFLDRFKKYVEEQELFTRKDKLLVAISGGVDSVLLAHLMYDLGYSFALAHCNFQLRGEESDADEAFVMQLAKGWNIPCFIKHFETKEESRKHGQSIQMVARTLRYNWFKDLLEQNKYDCLLTAHHQNDLLETVLLNLTRGTGLAGFHGILPKTNQVVRPFLFATRNQIEEAAYDVGLKWREDSSNTSNKYARNLIRNEIVPLLKRINPNVESTIVHTAALVGLSETFLHECLKEKVNEVVVHHGEELRISISKLVSEKHSLLILLIVLQPYHFSYETIKQLLSSAHGESGKSFSNASFQVIKDREFWILRKKQEETQSAIRIGNQDTSFVLSGRAFTIILKEGGKEKMELLGSKIMFFDFHKLTFPLFLRKWERGDKIVPYGMKGTKKVSDILIDLKLSLFEKEKVMVLESNGELAAIVGLRTSQKFAVDENTTRIWALKEE